MFPTGSNLPNLRHLRLFQIVARLESISTASQAARVSQPAVTQAIAKLEGQLGAGLFERRRSGCYLTEFGRTYLARIDRMFDEMERALLAPLVGLQSADDKLLKSILAKITTTHVRALIALVEHRSIESAALSLGVSTCSLNKATRDLEGVLKCTLFHPGSQGLAPSEPANELARRFGLAFRELSYAADEIVALKGISSSRVVIGALPLFPVELTARSVDDLLRIHPATRVLVVEGAYLPLLDELRAGKIDFLLGILQLPDWAEDVQEEPLLHDSFAVVARRGHPLSSRRQITRRDLARLEWVLPELGTPRRDAFEHMFVDSSLKPKVSIETGSIEFQRGILAASDRVSIASQQQIKLEQRIGLLAPLTFVPQVSRNVDGVTMRTNWKPTTVHLAFLDHLRRNSRDVLLADQSEAKLSDRRPATPNGAELAAEQPDRRYEPVFTGPAE
jgi:LysR family transcriptional regulator, regulator for genes of the gallate degradation pathway